MMDYPDLNQINKLLDDQIETISKIVEENIKVLEELIAELESLTEGGEDHDQMD